ncbi:acyltransferase [Luteimonas yindakuii]|uniref:acyltransferase family protein n=1 Tax=Luteimonas yindakuii TaxID=2565782 RepID=UPI0010A3375A|nr:acyltransferase [Luteimonas yindakuii]QCO67080.1 acyltransferase [Luteimonas yindakuii]
MNGESVDMQRGATAHADRTRFRELFLGRPRARLNHLDALDGLRGVAVLMVIASHLSNVGLLPQPGLSGTGKQGVYLFFVLSAFLLARILMSRPLSALGSVRLWADYALRRVLRIWPLYLFVLLLSWMLTRSGLPWHFRLDDASLLRHLTLAEGQSVLWSIPVEFTFYLWLPPLVLAMLWLRGHCPAWLEALAAGALMAAVLWHWPASEMAVNDVRLGPYLPVFLCGAFAARIDLVLDSRFAGRPGSWPWAMLALVMATGCVLMVPSVWARVTGTGFNPALNHGWFLAHGLAWSGLLLALLHGPSWLRRPFAWAPLRLVGVVSFSAYLWHMPVLDLVAASGVGRLPGLAPALVLVLTLILSMLSFLLLERPWRELRLAPVRSAPATR